MGTQDVVERVRAGGLLADPVVVLLSGGRDSVCLVDLAVELLGADGVAAVHVNYGLRSAAAVDEAACRSLCARLRVALDVVCAARAADATGNLHAWAREVRYAAAARVAEPLGRRVAVAHTAGDQAETVLYRLATSPGRRALLGMADEDGRLVRPLLRAALTREDTAAWCRARGLTWREDSANADPIYARARIRDGLLPALRAVDARAEANVVRTAAILRAEAEVLDEAVAGVLDGADAIEVARLSALAPALARLVVRRLAEDAVGAGGARAAGRLEDILALGAAGALDVGDGARAVVARGRLRFERSPRRGEPRP